MNNTRIAIIHPWIPQYRVNFFKKLESKLSEDGIDLDLFYGEPETKWKNRGDQLLGEIGTLLPTLEKRVFCRSVLMKSLKSVDLTVYDLVVVEQAIRNAETYWLVWKRIPLAFWGHGATYTQKASPILEFFKSWLTRKGVWFFAYTQGGKQSVVSKGFPDSRVSVLNNTFDTSPLIESLKAIGHNELEQFREKYNLTKGCTALFLGALDESKRLDILLEATSEVLKTLPNFQLLVMGDGPERQKIIKFAQTRTWVRVLEKNFGNEKALALRAADILTIPGRVGLVSIDSFVAGLPIVTTPDPFHPPEFEYIQNGLNAVVAKSMASADYADSIIRALHLEKNLKLRLNALACADKYSVDSMVSAFARGIKSALERDEGPK